MHMQWIPGLPFLRRPGDEATHHLAPPNMINTRNFIVIIQNYLKMQQKSPTVMTSFVLVQNCIASSYSVLSLVATLSFRTEL